VGHIALPVRDDLALMCLTRAVSPAKETSAMTNAPEPTAAETYAARRSDIARLLDVLGMELDRHADRAKADPKNWGLPGDLGKVRSDLMDTVAFISGMDREDVERFLSDAE
jgi:hypothetical protein